MRAKSVDPLKVQRIEIKNMTPELFKFHGKYAYESYDGDKIDQLQFNLHQQVKKHLNVNI